MALAIVDGCRKAVLPRRRGFDRLLSLTLGVERQIPALDCRLDGFVLGVVAQREQLERSLADDWLVVEGLGADACLDRVTCPVVSSVEPRVDRERLAGHQNDPLTDDRATGL